MIYKNFDELLKDNPLAVMGPEGYLEKPESGWVEIENGFIGIGYNGNEGGYWSELWSPSVSGKGHIPTNGYG